MKKNWQKWKSVSLEEKSWKEGNVRIEDNRLYFIFTFVLIFILFSILFYILDLKLEIGVMLYRRHGSIGGWSPPSIWVTPPTYLRLWVWFLSIPFMMGNCIKRVRVWVLPYINPLVGTVCYCAPCNKLLISKKKVWCYM